MERQAKREFENLPSLDSFRKIIKDIVKNRYSRYGSIIVSNKKNVDKFVSCLETNNEPLDTFSNLLIDYLYYYSFRGESRYFIDRIWNSPVYKHQFIDWLYGRTYHQNTTTLLKVWSDNNEKQLVKGLIKHVLGCIELLSRKESMIAGSNVYTE